MEEFPQSSLHVPVPQAVDERVQHWGHGRVHHSYQCMLQTVTGQGPEIHAHDCPIIQRHHCQVRATGRQGLEEALGGWNPQDCGKDPDIGDDDAQQWNREDAHPKVHHLHIEANVRTGQLQQRRNVTVEIGHILIATEGQFGCE